MHTWISKIIGTTSMRKSDIWMNISYGIVIRVPKSKMEMWKGGAAADKITINIWTVILGVVTNCFPNPVILHSIHKGPLHIHMYIWYVYAYCISSSATLRFNSVPSAMFTSFRCFTDGCSDYKGSPGKMFRDQLDQRMDVDGHCNGTPPMKNNQGLSIQGWHSWIIVDAYVDMTFGVESPGSCVFSLCVCFSDACPEGNASLGSHSCRWNARFDRWSKSLDHTESSLHFTSKII